MKAGAVAALLTALALFAPAAARADDEAGDFDFYVLSLSWSPSYCEAEGGDRDRLQCGSGRPFAFVLHGLWPQYERGWPSFCPSRLAEPTRSDVDAMLEIMPSPGLVRHQWRKHGSCSGLPVGAYFDLARDAYALVTVPPAYRRLEEPTLVDPDAVERAFIAANPGLPADGVAVTCDGRRLREVRICLTEDLDFRGCREIDRGGCRRDRVLMPPVR